ncbi:MAG: NADH-quinone oxidoreductase subunit L [Pyrinomonadaceae bacterium]
MYKLIWLIPLLPLAGAVVNGLLGARLRMSEKVIGSIAVGSIALAFLLTLAAVGSYGFGGDAQGWPNAYLSEFKYTWIEGTGEITQVVSEGASQDNAVPHTYRTQQTGKGFALDLDWRYQLDPLSAVFMLIITGVGLCIFVFALGYMHGDPGFYRFFAYLGLFMFSMLVLVMGANFVMMFVGWEGVGLCSYLLIGYYIRRPEAASAARKAFITNRIGDLGFILAIFAIVATFGSAQFTTVMDQVKTLPVELIGSWGLLSWIALGLFIGVTGKSAQIPLFVWLPDAMAGPTPVSALIHAATMVTAGIYLLARCNVIFLHSRTMMLVVAITGAVTALFAASIAITQNDIKKVLAYSTVSQLGLMVMSCGVGAFTGGVFHVLTHAFFKGLLFLGAGSVITALHHEQDLRRMGGLRKFMPKTYWTFVVGWLAICGIIPLSGFWSKDEILWRTLSTDLIPFGPVLWLAGLGAAFCTAFYMTRLVALAFWGEYRGPNTEPQAALEADSERIEHLHHQIPRESPPVMWIPLVALAIFAAVGGFVGIGHAMSGGAPVGGRLNIGHWLGPVIAMPDVSHPEVMPATSHLMVTPVHYGSAIVRSVETSLGARGAELLCLGISLVVGVLGIATGWFFYVARPGLPDRVATRFGVLYRASLNKFWIDELYGFLFTRRTMDAARGVYAVDSKVVDGAVNGTAWVTRTASRLTGGTDKYVVDGLVNAVANAIQRLGSPLVRAAQTGLTANYALVMVLGLVVTVAWLFGREILNAMVGLGRP